MEFSEALDLAIQKCEGIYLGKWEKFYKIYPFTTENIGGYIGSFDLYNKSLLTVGSSSDQLLNAILLGAKDLTLMDINPFSTYYFYLKMACILELNMDEFLAFFRYKDYPNVFKDNDNVFNIDLFYKIKNTIRNVDYLSYLFWDDLLQMYNPVKIRQRLFSNDEYRNTMLKSCNPYLCNNNTYMILRNKIKNINLEFVQGNIDSITFDRSFDNIWLSNIFTDWYSKEEIKEIFLNFNNYLNNEGKMLVSYLYDTNANTIYDSKWADIYNLELMFQIFSEYNFKLHTFVGVDGLKWEDPNYKKDSVLIYTKRK